VRREGAGERHALALAARKLAGASLGVALELDQPEQLLHAHVLLPLGVTSHPQPEADVLATLMWAKRA